MLKDNNKGKTVSLTVVGLGIKFLSHITIETKAHIEQASKLLYLVNNPAMKEWLEKSNPNAESLECFYQKFPLRSQCYDAITKHILNTLRENHQVCVALYGHPAVFANPALNAVIQARQEGYEAKLLPAVSAEDCLFADLLIDPGSCGCQSYEATDFLIHHRQFNTSSHLILWQINVIGVLGQPKKEHISSGVNVLVDYLTQFYPPDHEIILYEAAQYPHFQPTIHKICLSELSQAPISPISTLYIPPKEQAFFNLQMTETLGINIKELTHG
jgi:tetrapyrrole methylase family protein/MazG family protein